MIIKENILKNPNLTWKAKGLYFYISDGGRKNFNDILLNSSEGSESVRRGIKELTDNGVVELVRLKAENGKYVKTYYQTKGGND